MGVQAFTSRAAEWPNKFCSFSYHLWCMALKFACVWLLLRFSQLSLLIDRANLLGLIPCFRLQKPPQRHDSIFPFPDSPPIWSTCFCRVLLSHPLTDKRSANTSARQLATTSSKDPLSLHPIYTSHGALRELTSLCGSSTRPVPRRPDQD
jgi:hypothetical protein